MTRVVSGNTTSVCLSTYQLSDDQIQFYYLQLIHATGTKIVVHSSNSTHTILTSIFSFSFLSFLSSFLLQGAHAIMFQIFSNSFIFHTSCTAFFFIIHNSTLPYLPIIPSFPQITFASVFV
jgi:hypothetical protein